MTKAEIIRRGTELGVDYCADALVLRAGRRRECRAATATLARLRLKGFAAAGLTIRSIIKNSRSRLPRRSQRHDKSNEVVLIFFVVSLCLVVNNLHANC